MVGSLPVSADSQNGGVEQALRSRMFRAPWAIFWVGLGLRLVSMWWGIPIE